MRDADWEAIGATTPSGIRQHPWQRPLQTSSQAGPTRAQKMSWHSVSLAVARKQMLAL